MHSERQTTAFKILKKVSFSWTFFSEKKSFQTLILTLLQNMGKYFLLTKKWGKQEL